MARIDTFLDLLVKQDGTREEFDREKLLRGIRISCAKRPVSAADIDRLVGEIDLQGLLALADVPAGYRQIRIEMDITSPNASDEQLDELLRWQSVMLNCEERVQQLKREVNECLAQQGEQPRYASETRLDSAP